MLREIDLLNELVIRTIHLDLLEKLFEFSHLGHHETQLRQDWIEVISFEICRRFIVPVLPCLLPRVTQFFGGMLHPVRSADQIAKLHDGDSVVEPLSADELGCAYFSKAEIFRSNRAIALGRSLSTICLTLANIP